MPKLRKWILAHLRDKMSNEEEGFNLTSSLIRFSPSKLAALLTTNDFSSLPHYKNPITRIALHRIHQHIPHLANPSVRPYASCNSTVSQPTNQEARRMTIHLVHYGPQPAADPPMNPHTVEMSVCHRAQPREDMTTGLSFQSSIVAWKGRG